MYKVAAVTSTRADYGLLRLALLRLAQEQEIDLRLFVTGTHLREEYGNTVVEIEADEASGIVIDAEYDLLGEAVPDGRAGTAERTRLMLGAATDYLTQTRPDALLLLGDRYEIFACAVAAGLLNIPVVHISGGDVTMGADDDWFRHCITKIAKLHFPSCEAYRRRIIRMGEAPDTVFNVGGLGDQNIRSMQLLTKEELAASLGTPFGVPDALVTFHPETAGDTPPMAQVEALLGAVDDSPGLTWLFTAANADAGGDEINGRLAAYCESHPQNTAFVASLGVVRYLSAMKYARLVLGNSSSGVVETPSFGVPAVNIGHRQDGRLICDNVVCCAAERGAVAAAVRTATSDDFVRRARATQSPYNGGDTAGRMAQILRDSLRDGRLAGPKQFYDEGAET